METLRIVFNQITNYFMFYAHNCVAGSLYACNIGVGTCSRLLRQRCILIKTVFCWLSGFVCTTILHLFRLGLCQWLFESIVSMRGPQPINSRSVIFKRRLILYQAINWLKSLSVINIIGIRLLCYLTIIEVLGRHYF
jgi:hypothetical protein